MNYLWLMSCIASIRSQCPTPLIDDGNMNFATQQQLFAQVRNCQPNITISLANGI